MLGYPNAVMIKLLVSLMLAGFALAGAIRVIRANEHLKKSSVCVEGRIFTLESVRDTCAFAASNTAAHW